MDRLVKCLTLLAFLLCCCIHSTAQKTKPKAQTKLESGWTTWTEWSQCTHTCGFGVRNRIREWRYAPDDPYRSDQVFTNTDSISCDLQKACPVNGSWSGWGIWGRCEAPCGQGVRERVRNCNTPPPAHGGKNCTGKHKEISPCTEEPCPPTPDFFDMSQCVEDSFFTCTNQQMCVAKRQVCDGKVQCSDGSDEKGCRRRSRYKIGHVHFSSSSPLHTAPAALALLSLLTSTWLVRLLTGGHRHALDQSTAIP